MQDVLQELSGSFNIRKCYFDSLIREWWQAYDKKREKM